MQVKRKKLIAMLCAAALMTTSAGGLPLDSGGLFDTAITASADEYNNVSSFNSATEADPVLILTQNVGDLYITRADGTVNLNGHTVTNLYLQNKDPNKTVTVKNGTINNKIDGKSGYNDDYAGKIVLEDLTVKGNTWADGHTITIKSGTYNTIQNSTNKSTSAKSAVTIEGGSFNNLVIGSKGESYSISGGTFKNKPDDSWLAEEINYIQNADGQFVAAILVTCISLDSTSQTVNEGESFALTATISPNDATDKTIKWTSNNDSVKLYSNEDCTDEVGTDATSTFTVYAKCISAGNATVTATSNVDSTKSASCDVTVNEAQILPTYTVTIPATVDLGGAPATVSIDSMENIPSGQSVRVTIDGDADGNFTVEQADDKLSYTITGTRPSYYYADPDDTTQLDIEDDMEILHVDGPDDTGNPRYIELKFNKPDQEPRYAGDYTGTVTFNVSIS